MLILSGAVTIPQKLHPATVPIPFASDDCSIISPLKLISYARSNSRSFGVSVVGKQSKLMTRAVGSGRTSSTLNQKHWEDPDCESDSEIDDDEEEEEVENNLDFESDWEEERETPNSLNQLSASHYEEELVREVEQLLSPEEMAILQQNEAPNLDKISTANWKPLHTFALAGQIKFIDRLLDNGYDIDLVDIDGQSALHKATLGKKEAVVSHLLRKGANPHVRDVDGATPLHYAIQAGAMQTVKLLIKHNVDLNIADNDGWTPLHLAIQSRNRHIAKVLLINGADKTRRNKDGKTAYDLNLCYGKEFKSYDIAKLLKLVPANKYL